jgi:DNA polymerase III epsilon subunit-like protein
VAIDLETTGLDPRRDAIVAAAAIPFVGGEPQPGFVTLVHPGRPIPPASTAIHGITDEMVAGAPAVPPALRALEDACGTDVLVGHGVDFDLAVIGRERRAHRLGPLANRALDTMRLAAALHRGWTDHGLDAVAARVGISITGRHTPDGDAVAAGRILLALLPALAQHGLRTVPELIWFQESASLHP